MKLARRLRGAVVAVLCVAGSAAFAAGEQAPHPAASGAGIGTALDGSAATVRAPVVVDGRELFRVGRSGNYSANERAGMVNERLADELCLSTPAELELIARDGRPTIRLNGRHLMTIDAADVLPGMEPHEQAQTWLQGVKSALERGREERAPGYLPRAAVTSAAVLLCTLLAHWLLQLARRRTPLWLARRSSRSVLSNQSSPGAASIQLALLALQVAAWLVAAVDVTDRFPRVRQIRYRLIENALRTPVLDLQGHSYSILDAMWVVGMVAVLWIAVGAFTRLLRMRLQGAAGDHGAVIEPISVLLQYGLTFLGLVVILQAGGLDLSSLTFLASVLGVGIGFGLQNIANNFISGVIIAFERPIQVGDYVQVGELRGTVEHIGARSTEIQTSDRVAIIVPNSRFLEHEVVNWSHGDPLARLRVPVGVAYGSDIDRVRSALREAAAGHRDLVAHPPPEVDFEGFGDSALLFELEVWTRNPQEQRRIKSSLNYRIEASLRRHGIVVPFPQRTLHLEPVEVAALAGAIGRGRAEPRALDPAPTVVEPPPPVLQREGDPALLAHHLASVDLDGLLDQMCGVDGVDVRDRRHRLRVFPQCFVGAEAVDWLTERHGVSRGEAVRIGQSLVERGRVRHVLDEHPFRDGNFYYSFAARDPGLT